ncbi:MAG: bifunctional 4-hydroxy-2-oxoglutarate aldolase/2-dehydro-3-deoxy-phosphogluconate aldolase [Vulcanococcus sp.]
MTFGLLNTSDPSGLIQGLRRQPVLAVLRPERLSQARHQLQQLVAVGLDHVELAVNCSTDWVEMVRELKQAFPEIVLGAASVRSLIGLEAAVSAGLTYAVSPILQPALLERALALGITLVPGVFTPTELAQALDLGSVVVKLYPAASLGPGYWQSLSGPMGPLPFCIAAGGLEASGAQAWFEAGVDAVALGSTLFDNSEETVGHPRLRPGLDSLLRWLEQRDNAALLSD